MHFTVIKRTALRLAQYFGTRPGWWLDLQTHVDLENAADKLQTRISRTIKHRVRLPKAA